MIYPKVAPTNNDIAGHYDTLDAFYREIWGEHVHHGLWLTGKEKPEVAVRQLVDRVAAEAKIQPGDMVCDVGSGYGAAARMLTGVYQAQVTALTLSEAQYMYAVNKNSADTNPTYLLCDWLKNDLPAEAFDAVIAIECIAHIPDKLGFFKEAFRVLRPGGHLVVCAWLSIESPRPWQVRYLLEPICREGRLPSLGCASEYQALLADAGFISDAFDDLSDRVRRTWAICLRRILLGLIIRPRYVRFLLDHRRQDRIFLLTMPRLWLAFATGSFRYGLFTAHKPEISI
jgi:tocopherol O-methyltransferase